MNNASLEREEMATTEVAKEIRQALRSEFPSLDTYHFSVTTDRSSIHVTWEGEPKKSEVEEVLPGSPSRTRQDGCVVSDGLYRTEGGRLVTGRQDRDAIAAKIVAGLRFVFVEHIISPATLTQAAEDLGLEPELLRFATYSNGYSVNMGAEDAQALHMALKGFDEPQAINSSQAIQEVRKAVIDRAEELTSIA